MLRERTNGAACEPCFDFCYLDGAHVVGTGCACGAADAEIAAPGWLADAGRSQLQVPRDRDRAGSNASADWSNEELDTAHVGMVFDLLVKTHPELEHFMLSNTGHIGWARKADARRRTGFRAAHSSVRSRGKWSATFDGRGIPAMRRTATVYPSRRRDAVQASRSTIIDPFVAILTPAGLRRPIDYATVRLRLLTPDMEIVQLFWIGEDDAYFAEERSLRCMVRSSSGAQDLTFRIRGSPRGADDPDAAPRSHRRSVCDAAGAPDHRNLVT